MSTSGEPPPVMAAGEPLGRAIYVDTESGMRLLIDSESLDQAVYLYSPVFDGGTEVIVDLEIVMVNEAARHLPLSAHVVEGVRASDVFVDMPEALVAVNAVWRGQRFPSYLVERRGFVDGEPMVVRFEVATFRVADHIVQVSVDRTVSSRLASADTRFRLMAEASANALLLLSPDLSGEHHVVVYANPRALSNDSGVRIGARLPHQLDEIVRGAIEELQQSSPVRRVVERDMVTRRVFAEVTFTDVGDGQVMVTGRELTSEEAARAELERSDRVLRAIGAGSFGSIAVYEPQFLGSDLVEMHLLWSADGHGQTDRLSPLDPTSVLSPSELLQMAQAMLSSGDTQRSGWVPVGSADGRDRSVEFTLVLAGDRFVLEFVERTEELAARTALAMVTATSDAQRSFLSRVSHELRSPLNVIHGYTQLLSRLHLPDPASDHVEHIESGVTRMVQIIDDLLLLGQLDQGLLRIDHQAVDIGDLASDVAAAAAERPWGWAGLSAQVDGASGVMVRTDRCRFVTVAVLLAEASVMVQGTSAIEVAPFARGTRAGVQLLTDSDAAVVESVWRPFVTSHTIPGAGLGLAVARGLAAALDVLVEVRDVPGDPARLALIIHTEALT